ncbi:hypothetical protein HDU96_006908 [Phlyctochytrium bullatum]|nr:hypothetical protein HDU96_006908 [Phlyctochytrium bullatum]
MSSTSNAAALLARVQPYNWMTPVAAPIAWIMAWGMGANELSSNWGNVHGARVLKLWQIVLLAATFEFIGAMALGNGVASTIRSSIISSGQYRQAPEQLLLGFLVVLISCSIWLSIANYFGLPVSDSQTTVLSLVGVGIASRDFNAIRWDPAMRDIGLTWITSPLAALTLSFIFFSIFRILILKHEDSVLRAKRLFPIVCFLILGTNFFFFLFETPIVEDNVEVWVMVVAAFGASAVLTAISHFTYYRWLCKKMDALETEANLESAVVAAAVVEDETKEKAAAGAGAETPAEETAAAAVDSTKPRQLDRVESVLSQSKYTAFITRDYHEEALTADQRLTNVHNSAEVYRPGVELMFTHLLIIAACFKSFAHGASDVSNATGPLAAIVNILEDGIIDSRSKIPTWTLAVGATGMAIGILTYGTKTLTMLSVKLTRISPVRGVAIDLAAAVVIIVATHFKIPVSSTQTTVFAILGAGIASGIREKVHWLNFLGIFAGWVATLFFSSLFSYALYQLFARTPKL